MSSIVSILKAVLYELQPCRIVDIVNFVEFAKKCSLQIMEASRSLFIFTSKTSVNNMNKKNLSFGIILIVWFAGWWSSNYLEFGSMYIILSMMVGIFYNLGSRKAGEMSAYSVFNDGFKHLLGTMTAEQFDNEIRHRAHNDDWDDDADNADDINHQQQRARANHDQVKKRGKKARRTYEERLRKREMMRQNLEEAFEIPEDQFENLDDFNIEGFANAE